MRKLDLAGKRFNDIDVIAPAGTSSRGASLWRCRCLRCGNEFIAAGYRVNRKKDCGCAYRERTADLSGRTMGAMKVLRRAGANSHGDKLYLCRCTLCGEEKILSANKLKNAPKSCGCAVKKFTGGALTEAASSAGVEKCIINGCNVYTATSTTPNANNTTGYRWVIVQHRRGGDFILATFKIKGRRYYKGGFISPESAYAWALDAHRKALDEAGVATPERKRGKNK